MDNKLKPFIKWVGGKRQLLSEINKYIPDEYNTYYEPFLGAGAVLFHLQPDKAVINDMNEDLINAFKVVKNNFRGLLKELKEHENKNTKEYYYEVRNIDRTEEFDSMSDVSKAARFIYMNKVGYNGLYRVNRRGEYNVPYGRYKNPKISDDALLKDVSNYLISKDIKIKSTDFEKAVKGVVKGDLIYFDPPYDPLNETSSFTKYQKSGFIKEDQIRLKKCADSLVRKGAKVILSNSNTDFINDLYSNRLEEVSSDVSYYIINLVKARRSVNSKGDKRGKINEVLIISKDSNYEED